MSTAPPTFNMPGRGKGGKGLGKGGKCHRKVLCDNGQGPSQALSAHGEKQACARPGVARFPLYAHPARNEAEAGLSWEELVPQPDSTGSGKRTKPGEHIPIWDTYDFVDLTCDVGHPTTASAQVACMARGPHSCAPQLAQCGATCGAVANDRRLLPRGARPASPVGLRAVRACGDALAAFAFLERSSRPSLQVREIPRALLGALAPGLSRRASVRGGLLPVAGRSAGPLVAWRVAFEPNSPAIPIIPRCFRKVLRHVGIPWGCALAVTLVVCDPGHASEGRRAPPPGSRCCAPAASNGGTDERQRHQPLPHHQAKVPASDAEEDRCNEPGFCTGGVAA